MNTADLCAVGLEYYTWFFTWHEHYKRFKTDGSHAAVNDARQRWLRHKKKCKECRDDTN